MGRPLPKSRIGALVTAGSQYRIYGILDAGTGLEALHIVKQVNKKKFKCSNAAATHVGYIVLQEDVPAAVGEGRLLVSPFGGGSEYASGIQMHIVKTFEGNIYKYVLGVAAAAAGEATVDAA